jgi:hypothetical protein
MLGSCCGCLQLVGFGSEPVCEACLRVFFNGYGILKAHFGGLTLAFGIEETVVGRGNLIDDAAMGVVEGQIRCQQVRLGHVNFSAAAAGVKHQILDVKYRLEDAFRLAVEEFADESRLAKRDRDGNRRHRGIQCAACNAQSRRS